MLPVLRGGLKQGKNRTLPGGHLEEEKGLPHSVHNYLNMSYLGNYLNMTGVLFLCHSLIIIT